MITNDKTTERVELRSERVRKLIGEIPSALVHCGIAILILIFFALLAGFCLLPFPYSHGESILQHLIL